MEGSSGCRCNQRDSRWAGIGGDLGYMLRRASVVRRVTIAVLIKCWVHIERTASIDERHELIDCAEVVGVSAIRCWVRSGQKLGRSCGRGRRARNGEGACLRRQGTRAKHCGQQEGCGRNRNSYSTSKRGSNVRITRLFEATSPTFMREARAARIVLSLMDTFIHSVASPWSGVSRWKLRTAGQLRNEI